MSEIPKDTEDLREFIVRILNERREIQDKLVLNEVSRLVSSNATWEQAIDQTSVKRAVHDVVQSEVDRLLASETTWVKGMDQEPVKRALREGQWRVWVPALGITSLAALFACVQGIIPFWTMRDAVKTAKDEASQATTTATNAKSDISTVAKKAKDEIQNQVDLIQNQIPKTLDDAKIKATEIIALRKQISDADIERVKGLIKDFNSRIKNTDTATGYLLIDDLAICWGQGIAKEDTSINKPKDNSGDFIKDKFYSITFDLPVKFDPSPTITTAMNGVGNPAWSVFAVYQTDIPGTVAVGNRNQIKVTLRELEADRVPTRKNSTDPIITVSYFAVGKQVK